MKLLIPLAKLPNQTITVDLEDKKCVFEIITRDDSLYMNRIYVEDELKAQGIACLNKNNILALFNSGLSGKLYFYDKNGDEKPQYYGLNNRWALLYEV